ncbi:hydroxymethylglutaryl-CoA lyase [soil metagenome]
MEKVNWVECPRDAMQGLSWFIPTNVKANYINSLLKVGFDTLDFGSFVSPKAIPQLKDTAAVLNQLDLSDSNTKLLAIVANQRGGEDAVNFEEINYLGFPFSISETFQQRNTNSSITQSLQTVEALQSLCVNRNKELVIYISMAFGNPYGDTWNEEVALHWTKQIADLGIKTIAMSDTVGVASQEAIASIFKSVIPAFSGVEFGAHLHCSPDNWRGKVESAWNAGCRRFDSAMKGFGGCPMAEDELVGNLASENLYHYLLEKNSATSIHADQFQKAFSEAAEVFNEPLQHEPHTGV